MGILSKKGPVVKRKLKPPAMLERFLGGFTQRTSETSGLKQMSWLRGGEGPLGLFFAKGFRTLGSVGLFLLKGVGLKVYGAIFCPKF